MAFSRHSTALATLSIIVLTLPPVSATNPTTAASIDTAGFWLSFVLLVGISLLEAVLSLIWIRIRITADGTHPLEISCRVSGREISLAPIDADAAGQIAENGLPVGFYTGSHSSFSYTSGYQTTTYSNAKGCSTCGGVESKKSSYVNGAHEVTLDKFGSIMLFPSLVIRRFNPSMSLGAPTGLAENIEAILHPGENASAGRILENVVHLLVGLADVSLGVAGLALFPGSLQLLYNDLKDPRKAISFQDYSTFFLLYWLLGVVLGLCMIPTRSERRSIQLFGLPATIAFGIASLASLVLFAVGCWKIDVARREHRAWTPMLSYWIGGASAVSFPLCGIEVFHVFGVVGLVFLVLHTFNLQ